MAVTIIHNATCSGQEKVWNSQAHCKANENHARECMQAAARWWTQTFRAACCPVCASCTSQTVLKWPQPSFCSTVYRPRAYCSPTFTGW